MTRPRPPCSDPESRRRDSAQTRAAILAAARWEFLHCGYEGAGLRDIGRRAGADAALVSRYFGGKEALLAAVLETGVSAEKITHGERADFGRRFAETFLDEPSLVDGDGLETLLLMLRAATSPNLGPVVRGVLERRFFEPMTAWLGPPDARVRAQLLCACLIGLAVDGLIWKAALLPIDRPVFVERLGATLQGLVDG